MLSDIHACVIACGYGFENLSGLGAVADGYEFLFGPAQLVSLFGAGAETYGADDGVCFEAQVFAVGALGGNAFGSDGAALGGNLKHGL